MSRTSIPTSQENLYYPKMDKLNAIVDKDKEVARFVRAAREKLELTQEKMAEIYDMTKGNISGWENGRHEPSYEIIADLSAKSGLPMPSLASSNDDHHNSEIPTITKKISELVLLFGDSDEDGRESILDAARASAKAALKLRESSV